ncbi:hypothetical protein I302_107833 [Kwoniella bestiolae CBS 10118]|uniref:Xylanolytic transcriptional activator regulatory domain-containing protein n=1 Tax=Kwoniella bestiolae CBS 10118 TaxID=1296100 RepID=A0A1B9FXF6_9TREE|nr:hypothetical protein I302_06427 [Kwoniella bestiolae CBS 10118]OCF23445.1 hypothetical protein I302_06427 [Kwoniella bestiolae CBS 10118]
MPDKTLSEPSPQLDPGPGSSSDPSISVQGAVETTGSTIWLNDILHGSDSMIRTTIVRDDPGSSLDYIDYTTSNPLTNSSGLDPAHLETRLAPLAMVETGLQSSFAFPPPGGDDIWQLLTQEALPDSHSLHASPRFLAELGLNSESFFQSSQDLANDRSPHNVDTANRTNANLYLDRGSFEGPALSSSGVDAEERGAYVLSATSTMIARMSSGHPSEGLPLSSETLALCLNMFWTRVWPTSPIIHPSTFNMRQTSAPLLINMIALGAMASQKRSLQIKGNSLWTLVNRSITTSWTQLIENKGLYDPCKGVQLIQTLACGIIFAYMSSSSNIIHAASMSVMNGIRWAYLAGMNDPEIMHKNFLPLEGERLSPSDLDIRWRQWAAMEDLKRCLCLVYQADCVLARMSDVPPTFRPTSIPFGGMWDDEATYLASTATSWQRAVIDSSSKVSSLNDLPIGQIYRYLFQDDTAQDQDLSLLPVMTRTTLIEGLTSLIIDPVQPHLVPGFGIADLPAIGHALARYYTVFLDRTTDPRSQSVLIGRWHEAAITLGYAFAKQKHLSGQQLWRSPIGRHLLLHANAIRQSLEDFRVGKAKIPYPGQAQVSYIAAVVFKDYIAATSEEGPSTTPLFHSLNIEADWEQLNRILKTCSSQVDSSDSSELTNSTSSHLKAADFVLLGGIPLLHGIRISIHDIDPFLTVLTALGRTFPRAEELAMKLTDRYM